jgi:hypothetical protein
MFTTTNVAGTTASAGGGGPIAAAVPPPFQIISTPVTGPSSSSVSSTTWRLTPTASSSSLIKQPSVVSIINGNMNVSSTTTLPINSTGVTMPTNGNILYIATTNSQQHNPITSGNLIFQSPQTVRLVSSTPTLTLLNNRNTTVINNSRQILTPPISSSSSTHFKPGICIDTPILGRLAPITIQRQITNSSLVQQSRSLTTTLQSQNTNQIDEQVKYKKQILHTHSKKKKRYLRFFFL